MSEWLNEILDLVDESELAFLEELKINRQLERIKNV